MAIRLTIAGCCGRMGQAIARCALQDSVFSIGAAFEAKGHQAVGQDLGMVLGRPLALGVKVVDDANAAIGQGDVLIEFTVPDVTIEHAQLAQQLRKPMVIGTTGLSEAQRSTLEAMSKTIPIVFSPNMSVGVNVLFELAQIAAERLPPSFNDVRIIETHHEQKKDKPSGTAKQLQALVGNIRSARHQSPEIPCESIREGEVVGDHTISFSSPFERVELTHHAETRDVFAVGALQATQFVVKQTPGLYDMSHVLRGDQVAT